MSGEAEESRQHSVFLDSALGLDGLFLLRQLGVNVGELAASCLVRALFRRHLAALAQPRGRPHRDCIITNPIATPLLRHRFPTPPSHPPTTAATASSLPYPHHATA